MATVLKVEATKAKATFSKLLERAKRQDVEITKHGRIQAYVISPTQHKRLKAIERTGEVTLEQLDKDFDSLVQRMQTDRHKRAAQNIERLPLKAILAAGAGTGVKRNTGAKRVDRIAKTRSRA